MKEFNLEAAKKGAPVQTRDGRPARIICTDLKNKKFPILASYIDDEGEEQPCIYTEKGEYWYFYEERHKERYREFDLVMAPTKRKGWMNIYKEANNKRSGEIFNSRKEAEDNATDPIDTIEIEWEERL